jgi:phosphatidylglycerophosphate synthase
MGAAADIAAIYRASKKKKDINFFTQHIARPPAAVFVWLLKSTPITPNQVTFLATVVAAGAGAIFVGWLSWLGLVVGAAVFELSFVLDCVDGMLARLRKIASPLGHLLDFLMDELKAMLIYGCVAIRLWRTTGHDYLLIVGIAGLFCLASGIALTSFMRRPEYSGKSPTEDGDPAQVGGRKGPIGMAISGLEWAARIVVHYPQYIWICALANHIEIYFWAYGAVNVLYLGLSFLKIFFRLGRFTS